MMFLEDLEKTKSLSESRTSGGLAQRGTGRQPVMMCGNFQIWRLRKKSICCVTLHLSSLRRTLSTPHSSRFASLAYGAFYFVVWIKGFYETISFERHSLKEKNPMFHAIAHVGYLIRCAFQKLIISKRLNYMYLKCTWYFIEIRGFFRFLI